jgi:hypothetical protein
LAPGVVGQIRRQGLFQGPKCLKRSLAAVLSEKTPKLVEIGGWDFLAPILGSGDIQEVAVAQGF